MQRKAFHAYYGISKRRNLLAFRNDNIKKHSENHDEINIIILRLFNYYEKKITRLNIVRNKYPD